MPYESTSGFETALLSPLGLSTLDAVIKSVEIVRRDSTKYKEDFGFTFDEQVDALANIYCWTDLDVHLAFMKSIEPNESLLKGDMKAIMKFAAAGARGINTSSPLAFCVVLVAHKYGKAISNAFHLTFPFIEWMYDEIWNPRAQPNLGLQYKFFSESKIYKNLKNEYGIPSLFALLPSGQKYGGFVKAVIHVNYLNRAIHLVTFLAKMSRSRADFNSKIYSDEKRLEFFNKLDIKYEDCREWSKTFEEHYPQHKNIHKLFGQIE